MNIKKVFTFALAGALSISMLAGKKIALQDGSTSEDALKADTATYESVGDDNISRFKENSQVLPVEQMRL